MKLRTILHYLDEMADEDLGASSLYFVNENGDYLGISEIEEDVRVVTLVLGEEPLYKISDLEDDLSEYGFQPSTQICAYDPIEDVTYSLEGGWDVDEDGNVYMDIHESLHTSNCVIAKEEYAETDTSKYVSSYDEHGLFDKLAKFATRLGVKVVYLALWLYYAAKCASLTNSAIIIGALGYLMCPIDLILDILPIVGFSDDAAILLAAYSAIVKLLSSEQIENINRMAKEALRKYFKDFNEDDIAID